MAKQDEQIIDPPSAGPAATLPIRQLTEEEIRRIERALGKRVDRTYLVYWVSESIRGIVQSAGLPTPRQVRIDLIRMAREGRLWIRHICEYPPIFSPRERSERDALVKAAEVFCESLDHWVARAASSTKAGQKRMHPAFEAFLDNMIGIAKKTGITPSTPKRTKRIRKARIAGDEPRERVRVPGPQFLRFVVEAIAVAREVINTSPLPDRQKAVALSILQMKSEAALIKVFEKRRGRIQDYQPGTIGLTEWR